MTEYEKAFQQELNKEFHKHLHEEKLRTLAERSKYISRKIAFITGFFGLGSLTKFDHLGGSRVFSSLFFFIPVIAIGYDLYINAADSSIKKMGAFLGKNSDSGSGESEKAWEKSSGDNRDKIAPFACLLLSCAATIGAWLCYYYFSWKPTRELFSLNFIDISLLWDVWPNIWFIFCLVVIIYVDKRYSRFIKNIDQFYPATFELCNRENKRLNLQQ